MSILTIQLNHPGAEKPFRIGLGYVKDTNGLIVREWNRDQTHYRKFIRQKGKCLNSLSGEPNETDLLFWGEWEGNSTFSPLPGRDPNGIHSPFHSLKVRNHQNTDPYVYGDRFKYAICKQRGRLTQLDPGSLILFGSSFKSGFALDTVFVVEDFESAIQVGRSDGEGYSQIYREATLEQLDNAYLGSSSSSNLRLYRGRTWEDDPEIFSYVPCKPANPVNLSGFKRVTLPFDALGQWGLSSNPTGIKIIGAGKPAATSIWTMVTEFALNQGFCLGVHIEEPA